MTWFANVLIIVGIWQTGNKKRAAFLLTALGEFIWTVTAAFRSQWDIASICAVFTVLAVVNWHKWGQSPAAEPAAVPNDIDCWQKHGAEPVSRPTREGWNAFDEGWSRHSNPYPSGTNAFDEWAWAWHEAESSHLAQMALAAGADPEDYK